MRLWSLGAAALSCTVLASACAGGGTTLPAAHSVAGSPSQQARLTIVVPNATKAAAARGRSVPGSRQPAYISAATQSAVINVTPPGSTTPISGYPVTANLTPTSTGCASTLAGTQCTLALAVLPGSYLVSLTTYDGLGGSGAVLSAAQSVPFTVVAGTNNTLALTLGGLPASVAIVSMLGSNFSLPPGGTATVSVLGVDADGNIILGAGAPAVTLTSSDPSSVSVGVPSAAAPNAFPLTAAASYTLAQLTATATSSPSAGGLAISSTSTVTPAAIFMVSTSHHIYVISYGNSSYNTGFDQFSESGVRTFSYTGTVMPYGIGFNPLNGYLYYDDTAHRTIGAFSESGTYLPLNPGFPANLAFIELVCGADNGNVYVQTVYTSNPGPNAPPPPLYEFDMSGNRIGTAGGFPLAGAFGSMALDDHNHRLYVVERSPTAVQAFDESGNAVALTGTFPGLTPNYIAFDSANDLLYVADYNAGTVAAFDANGNPQTLSGNFSGLTHPGLMAFDPGNNVLYIADGSYISAYDQSGNFITTFPTRISQGNAVGLTIGP
jgi:DNA-binding beta-propeller fold protein YncE